MGTTSRSGFTLIELLVVIAIIGMGVTTFFEDVPPRSCGRCPPKQSELEDEYASAADRFACHVETQSVV